MNNDMIGMAFLIRVILRVDQIIIPGLSIVVGGLAVNAWARWSKEEEIFSRVVEWSSLGWVSAVTCGVGTTADNLPDDSFCLSFAFKSEVAVCPSRTAGPKSSEPLRRKDVWQRRLRTAVSCAKRRRTKKSETRWKMLRWRNAGTGS